MAYDVGIAGKARRAVTALGVPPPENLLNVDLDCLNALDGDPAATGVYAGKMSAGCAKSRFESRKRRTAKTFADRGLLIRPVLDAIGLTKSERRREG